LFTEREIPQRELGCGGWLSRKFEIDTHSSMACEGVECEFMAVGKIELERLVIVGEMWFAMEPDLNLKSSSRGAEVAAQETPEDTSPENEAMGINMRIVGLSARTLPK
jgi:hypothetical protein